MSELRVELRRRWRLRVVGLPDIRSVELRLLQLRRVERLLQLRHVLRHLRHILRLLRVEGRLLRVQRRLLYEHELRLRETQDGVADGLAEGRELLRQVLRLRSGGSSAVHVGDSGRRQRGLRRCGLPGLAFRDPAGQRVADVRAAGDRSRRCSWRRRRRGLTNVQQLLEQRGGLLHVSSGG